MPAEKCSAPQIPICLVLQGRTSTSLLHNHRLSQPNQPEGVKFAELSGFLVHLCQYGHPVSPLAWSLSANKFECGNWCGMLKAFCNEATKSKRMQGSFRGVARREQYSVGWEQGVGR